MKPKSRSVKAVRNRISSFFKRARSVGKNAVASIRRVTRRIPRPNYKKLKTSYRKVKALCSKC